MIFVAAHRLATVPGITAVIIAPPWVELVIAFPGIVVDFSLLPESSDLSWSGGVSEGGRHGEVVGVLLGAVGIGEKSGNLDGELVVFLGGLLYCGSSCVQCSYLGHSAFCVVRCISFLALRLVIALSDT